MSETELLYRNLDATLKHVLRDMSNWGYIYLGRTGAGLTHSFRKETMKVGTIKACEEARKCLGADATRLLEVICIEGPRWVPYKRLEDALYNIEPFKSAATTINNNNNKSPSAQEPPEKTATNNNKKKEKNKEMKSLS